jgi:hypothetical protein
MQLSCEYINKIDNVLAQPLTNRITAISLAAYAIMTYRRLAADAHHHRYDIKGYGFNDDLETQKLGLRPTLEKRLSSASGRLSFSSQRGARESFEAVPLDTVQRTPSFYNHERDTQFEDFVKRRSSTDKSRDEVGILSPKTPEVEMTAGTVKAGRPRGSSIQRDVSLTNDHVLVAVPEEEDDDPKSQDKKDKEALLGPADRDSEDGARVPQDVDVAEPRWARE